MQCFQDYFHMKGKLHFEALFPQFFIMYCSLVLHHNMNAFSITNFATLIVTRPVAEDACSPIFAPKPPGASMTVLNDSAVEYTCDGDSVFYTDSANDEYQKTTLSTCSDANGNYEWTHVPDCIGMCFVQFSVC